ncbi:MAG: ABC transporter substrate-binding protein [Thermomicrobiales bacterium]|nr:ABC transporter substrate-binding protein [Thermomicrobiales bacterium]
MKDMEITALVDQLREGSISRRGFMRRATALGISAGAAGMMARSAAAQADATPVADDTAAADVVRNAVTREEAMAAINAAFPFTEPENMGGQVIYQQSTDIGTVNPVLSTDVYSSYITGLMFESLIGGSVVDGKDIPTGLADGWEISADGIEYTIFLNPNVTFHDGTPLTSADVVFTFDAALAEDSMSVRKGTVDSVLDRYEAIDDHTVKFYAKAPSGIFLTEALGQFGIVAKHIWEEVNPVDWPSDGGSTGTDASRVIGTGPFKFGEWKLGETVSVVKNENYWIPEEVPYIDEFIYQVVADSNTVIAALQTGATDLGDVGFGDADGLMESNPELQIVAYDTTSMNYYHQNQDASKFELFTDVAIRQAMLYALDRQLIAEAVYFGYAIQADGTQPVLSIAYDTSKVNTVYNYDPEKAKAILEEAGWVDADGDGVREKDGQKLSFEVIYSEGTSTYPVQIPVMQDSWKAVGMEAITSAIPFQSLLDATDAGTYNCCVQGFQWSIDGGQDAMFATDMTPPNGFNSMRYSNADYDALILPSKTEVDQAKRIEILQEQSNILNDDAAVGINVFRQNIMGAGPNVHNFFPNGYSTLWWLNKAWVDAR